MKSFRQLVASYTAKPSQRKRPARRLGYESLEGRALMAGFGAAMVTSTDLSDWLASSTPPTALPTPAALKSTRQATSDFGWEFRVRTSSLAETAIIAKAEALGASFTGPAVSGIETAGANGYRIRYQLADIYYGSATGTYEVHGDIRAKYNSMGGPLSSLGLPTSDEMTAAERVNGTAPGRVSQFQNGAIYWNSLTRGTFALIGANNSTYDTFHANLGFPTSDQQDVVSSSPFAVNRFEKGAIYRPLIQATGYRPVNQAAAMAVYGDVYDLWQKSGAENGPYGAPVASTRLAAFRQVGINMFTNVGTRNVLYGVFQNGEIFSHSEINGAVGVQQVMYQEYARNWRSLGLPIAPEQPVSVNGRMGSYQKFEQGILIRTDSNRVFLAGFTPTESLTRYFSTWFQAKDLIGFPRSNLVGDFLTSASIECENGRVIRHPGKPTVAELNMIRSSNRMEWASGYTQASAVLTRDGMLQVSWQGGNLNDFARRDHTYEVRFYGYDGTMLGRFGGLWTTGGKYDWKYATTFDRVDYHNLSSLNLTMGQVARMEVTASITDSVLVRKLQMVGN